MLKKIEQTIRVVFALFSRVAKSDTPSSIPGIEQEECELVTRLCELVRMGRPSKKKGVGDDCTLCSSSFAAIRKDRGLLLRKYNNLAKKHKELKAEAAYLKAQSTNLTREDADEQFSEIHSWDDEFSPSDLHLGSFQYYLDMLLDSFPILRWLLGLLYSKTHMRKTRAKNTSAQWFAWAAFHKAFIMEQLLRTRNAKITLRTPMLLGLYFTLVKVSDPAWRILQRLKIISSRATVEAWLEKLPPSTLDRDSQVLFSFDNLLFYKKVTHNRTTNRPEIIHLATQYAVNLFADPIPDSQPIWQEEDDDDFLDWCEMSFTIVNDIANNCYRALEDTVEEDQLKYTRYNPYSSIRRSDWVILPPQMGANVSSYDGTAEVLANFHRDHMVGTTRRFAFVSCDQAAFALVWNLRNRKPEKFGWVVPVPGEFHWHWHILKGIFRLYSDDILYPFATYINYPAFDPECNNFHKGEDFFQIVTLAIFPWIKEMMRLCRFEDLNELLHHAHDNTHAYEIIYFFLYCVCPYWVSRGAVKNGNGPLLEDMWRYWMQLFITTGKFKYTQLTVIFMWIQRSLHPSIRDIYLNNRSFSFSGSPHTGVAFDGINEMVCMLAYS